MLEVSIFGVMCEILENFEIWQKKRVSNVWALRNQDGLFLSSYLDVLSSNDNTGDGSVNFKID